MHEEEDIDTEAIQAQIDLSMSVTNDLVSSWIKSSDKPKTPYNQALEAELKEYMRRPPRLGVGASVPESTSVSSRETARLKGSLVGKGKKRAREDEGESFNRSTSDDEGESRTGAIRKKPVPNPFTMPTTKKKKKLSQADVVTNAQDGASVKSPGKVTNEPKNHSTADPISESEDEKRKKTKKNTHPPVFTTRPGEQKETTIKAPTSPASSKQTATNPASSPSHKRSLTHESKFHPNAIHTVLNLNGPVGDRKDDSASDEPEASSSKPNKKRRKRKKKKKTQSQVEAGAVDGSAEMSRPDA
ncbi:hypothetical protein DFH05DRAFT_1463906 [Lentinula detonsa]|uniref:Uncharacterized protein n=1 Tax=Lentinula detonsa TaxID=2804962 RepID=A0A9W8NRZ5_9AGAR|nr:hypothetical protein DFH05DRAFT_1463906 [Lentinula detonsa]KAJ3987475.1 hypothetical protein F5890DRAFT_1497813 [Lentinula detonsa]